MIPLTLTLTLALTSESEQILGGSDQTWGRSDEILVSPVGRGRAVPGLDRSPTKKVITKTNEITVELTI